ncbi:MAG TPA: hypothetical protein VFM55_11990 [Micromonosporaceae bacterium]|nr:hypothetical protein [Micromonosporaceae bacterium]
MDTKHRATRPAHEIACDESGWEGANLVAGSSDVVAYASVRLSVETAAECMHELSVQPGHSGHQRAREYKASHVLRTGRRSAVRWLLGPDGPLHGNARVHLTEKAYFVVGRVIDLFLGHSADAASAGLVVDQRLAAMALTICRRGPATFGGDRWRAFLVAANAVLRTWKPRNVREPVDDFADLVEALRRLDGDDRVNAVLNELRLARPSAYAARARLIDNRVVQPALEPLIPALASTILHWARAGQAVSIVHDEQSALTERRVRRLERQLLPPGQPLAFRQVDSRLDARVQVADVLAGVARRVAADELRGPGDGELGRWLRPYVDPASRWCDERSWASLAPAEP